MIASEQDSFEAAGTTLASSNVAWVSTAESTCQRSRHHQEVDLSGQVDVARALVNVVNLFGWL